MDYHKILGTKPGDGIDKIKAAYRRLAAQLHPDKGGDAHEFSRLHEAYEQLKKQTSRRVDIPIYNQSETIRVQIPMDRLISANRYQFSFNGNNLEADLPAWQASWKHEHVFVLKEYNMKLQVVAVHDRFWIQDGELTTRIDINQIDSLLGTTKTLLGQDIDVLPGATTGDQIKIKGLGLFNGGSRADLTCIFNIIPVQLTKEDLALSLTQLQEKYCK